jgi:hypothetical protein
MWGSSQILAHLTDDSSREHISALYKSCAYTKKPPIRASEMGGPKE